MPKVKTQHFRLIPHLFLLLIIFMNVSLANAQRRDNLTNEEDLIVREAQEIDLRMKVFVKIVDRRLFALNDSKAATSKQAQKVTNNDWGELRIGTIGELFWDIQKTLDEAIGKIDDVAERDSKNPLLGRAVHILADGCKIWQPQFKSFLDKIKEEKEKGVVLTSIDNCSQITEASTKISGDAPKEDKKKKP